MSYFEFPHTRTYDGDLGYIIKMVTELTNKYNDFFAYNSIKFADPLQWDITKQYEAYTIVFDYDSGYSYISKQPVPAGIALSNVDFWCVVGPLIVDSWARTEIYTILSFIANIYETGTTATAVRASGEYVVVNGGLYKTTTAINIGETYTSGYNMTPTTIENMILDKFPIQTSDIADGAVTTNKIDTGAITTGKIAVGAVTTAKIADHTVNKTKMVEDKYIFIGDSYNKDYHHSWGEKVAARLGLTIGTDCWLSATSGGSMGNGLIYTDVSTLIGTMTADEKNSITKIAMVFGVNDWSQTEADIATGTANLENLLVANFPNAELIYCAAQWGYYNDTYRQGVMRAFNIYAATFKHTRYVDKAYTMMMNPALLDSDMVHPTNEAANNIASVVINALNGGSKWTYVSYGQYATVDPTSYGGNATFQINGMITEAGTHIWRKSNDAVFFSPALTVGNTFTQIGTIAAADNNFFQREANIAAPFKATFYDASNNLHYDVIYGTLKIKKHSDSDPYWDVFFRNELYVAGSYNITITNMAIQFDTILDYTQT